MKRIAFLLATVAAVIVGSREGNAGRAPAAPLDQAARSEPKLLVIIVVDQMRFDYLDRYARLWTGGLKRLMTEGAVFERGFYPYLNTVTCAGHATI